MKTAILGCGFTGTQLLNYLPDAICTELPHLCIGNQIPFDFHDLSTWNDLPDFDQAIITFKMTDPILAEKLSNKFEGKKIIILSSARNLLNTLPNETISEKSELSSNARAISESYFQNSSIILYLGLIWGLDRSLSKWLSEERIKNGEKFINLIQVNDLCKIIIHLLNKRTPKGKFLVSDGFPIKWIDIAKSLNLNLPMNNVGLESRKFDTSKLKTMLPNDFQFQKP